MHELSLCQNLMDQVMAIADEHDAEKVVRIVMHIGPLSGVEPLLLESAFTISKVGTIAEEAAFITEMQPIRIHCQCCGTECEASVNNLVCAACGAYDTCLLSGDELILAQVELEYAAA